MTASIRVYLLFIFSLLFVFSGSAFADSDDHHHGDKHHSKRYFLAPDINTSDTVVNGVDVATGRLNRSDIDLSSATLSLSRVYDGSNWNHQYTSRLWVDGLSYNDWQGTKSKQYKKKKKACTKGWKNIKATVFNGKLSNAKAKYKKGFCQIRLNGKTKATLAIHRSGKKIKKSVVLTRPDGTSMTFAKKHHQWKPLSGIPFTLSKSGKNWKLSTPSDSVEVYDRWGSLIKVTTSNGQSTRLRYSHAGKLKKVTGPFGRTLRFTYNGWKVSSVTGSQGTVSYTYDNGQLSSVTKVDGSTMEYQYDNGKLRAVVDALGQTVATYTYDSQGKVATAEGKNGTRKTSFNYTSSVSQVTNIANNTTDNYKFRVIKSTIKLIKTTYTDGSVSTQSYDNNGYPRQSVAINGTKTRTYYNERGLLEKRVASVGLPSQKITLTHWHKQFRKPILQVEGRINTGNRATKSVYNKKGLLVKRIQGIIKTQQYQQGHHAYDDDDHHGHHHKLHIALKYKRITKYRYNSKAQLTKTIAPNGAITLTSYDSDGNRTSGANALGQENKTLSFDVTGKPLVLEDVNGIQTTNIYDVAGRLSNTSSNGRNTSYEYDVAGRQTKVTYADGSTTTNEYDTSGNLTKTIDQDGNVSESSFDSNHNQTSTQVKDNQGSVILSSTSSYNDKNQLTQSTNAQGNTTSYQYDASGNQTKVTDANGNASQNTFDANNRLVKTTDALGGETSYVYDNEGNRTSVTTPNGATTTFEYDSFNQLTKETSPDRGTTTYQYDGSGNQIGITDANGNIKNISYDILNRKTGESWTGAPDLTIAYNYDNCANGVGKLCGVVDKSGSTSFAFDPKGQITQKIQNIGGVDLTKSYTYNNEGKLTSETYPSGAQINYGYNVDKIDSISINGNPYMTDITYNAANQLISWNWADGTAYTKTYDANGRLATFPLGNETRTLNYDSNGNITGWTDTGTAEVKNFTYDALNRLTAYSKEENSNPLQNQMFSYDANGNRLGLIDDNVQTVYSILANTNRLDNSLSGVEVTAYQYDDNGNITDDGEHTYSYDSRNRLTGVDGTSSYLFNANNMRVKKTTPAGTVLYGWDNDRIYAEYDQSGTALQETVYFGSTPVALLKNGNTYRVFADQIDTPRVVSDSTNTTLWAWDSKPFGETAPSEDVDGDGTDLNYNLRLSGQYYDAETGKYYNFNRDYNPVTGRYVQSDPIGLGGGINSYAYTAANPMNLQDVSGLAPVFITDLNRELDVSIDVHGPSDVSFANVLINRFKNLKFTVYIYSKHALTLADKFPNAEKIGFHIDPINDNTKGNSLTEQINDFYAIVPGPSPVSIHGQGKDQKVLNIMGYLSSKATLVRAASNVTISPLLQPTFAGRATYNTTFKDSRYVKIKHYFVHSNESKPGSIQFTTLNLSNWHAGQ